MPYRTNRQFICILCTAYDGELSKVLICLGENYNVKVEKR